MRKLSMIGILTALIMVSCGKKEREQLQNQADSLTTVIQNKDAIIMDMNSFMNQVAEGLDSIYHQEHIIYMGHHEVTGKKFTRVDIKQRINDLSDLVKRQKNRIAELEDSMTGNANMNSLKRIIRNLNIQLEEKELRIQNLEQELLNNERVISTLKTDIIELGKDNDSKTEVIDMQDKMINEAFYIMGTSKELRQKGFTEKKGIKIWEKTKLKMQHSQTKVMTKVDVREFKELTIYSKKAILLSDHPATSYTLERKGNAMMLRITNTAEFWSLSRILVIQMK